jgi:hypothetical protein
MVNPIASADADANIVMRFIPSLLQRLQLRFAVEKSAPLTAEMRAKEAHNCDPPHRDLFSRDPGTYRRDNTHARHRNIVQSARQITRRPRKIVSAHRKIMPLAIDTRPGHTPLGQ